MSKGKKLEIWQKGLLLRILEFYRTHTLCTLSSVSTDCACSDIVGLHMLAFCIRIALHSCIACRRDMAYCNTILREPFSHPVNGMLSEFLSLNESPGIVSFFLRS